MRDRARTRKKGEKCERRDGETEGEIESGTEGDWGRGARSVAIRRGGEKRGQSVCNPGRSKPL